MGEESLSHPIIHAMNMANTKRAPLDHTPWPMTKNKQTKKKTRQECVEELFQRCYDEGY